MRTLLGSALHVAVGLGAVVLLSGCDPARFYRPQGWRAVDGHAATWITSIHDVEIETAGVGGLIGTRMIVPEFIIRNRTEQVFVLESADLLTPTGRRAGRLSPGDLESRRVRPGAMARIVALWDLQKPLTKDLGSNPQVILEFTLDQRRDRFAITYEQVH